MVQSILLIRIFLLSCMIYKNVVSLLFMVYVVNLKRIMYDYAMIHLVGVEGEASN